MEQLVLILHYIYLGNSARFYIFSLRGYFMKLCRIIFSLGFVIAISSNLLAQNQKMVLFETFTNSYEGCTLNDDFDAAVKATLAGTNGSKLIHLNHHVINVGDPMAAASPQATNTVAVLSAKPQQPWPDNCSAVDRTNMNFVKLSGTVPGGKSEWDTRIAAELKLSAPVSIKLISAYIDTISSSSFSRLVATIEVTSTEATPDTMTIHYALLQDNILYPQCPTATPPGPTEHDNVTRYITQKDSLLDLKGKPVGTVSRVTYIQNISKSVAANFLLADMKLVAFVEDHNGDFHVAQAAILKIGLDTLKAPAPALSLNSSVLDGNTYSPEDLIDILFDKTTIDSVKIEFSSDNGAHWQQIGTTHEFNFYWNAPAITTTTGKIRISDLKNGNPLSTETGTFSIMQADHSISLYHPNGNDIVYIGQKFNITWNEHGVDTFFIEYSSDDGNHWQSVYLHKGLGAANDTVYSWNVNTAQYIATSQARMRLRPFLSEFSSLTSTSDAFQLLNTVGSVSSSANKSFSISASPQPLGKGEDLKVYMNLDESSGLGITLYDLGGKKVFTKVRSFYNAGETKITLGLPNLPAGTYILEAMRDDGEHGTVKIEIQ
jgi:hypothetical protein